jgi:N-hydroxyarylamine O-acetyltransferase
MRVDRLLARIGLSELPTPDVDGLHELHRAYVAAIPYEALAVQLGESEPLDAERLVGHVLRGGRGGYCFEVDTVLHALLLAAGFSVRRHQAHVNRSELTNHMALVVDLGGERWLADAGLGEGPLDPVPLADGAVTPGPLPWTVERLDHGWCLREHEFGSITDVVFADEPSDLAVFQPHHRRLSSARESSFVQTLVVQRPYDDRIVSLRSRTLFVDGPGRREREVLADLPAFGDALWAEFGIDPDALGRERLQRLWSQRCAQHETCVAG